MLENIRSKLKFMIYFIISLVIASLVLIPDVAFAETKQPNMINSPESIELPEASATHLPRWRGFNLLEKFNVKYKKPFQESDFKWISELGFNFIRLPLDYRCWIKNNDWNQIDEKELQEIDQAVAWGQKYKIHVSLNFHRAPGYCVNDNEQEWRLWTDPETQIICAKHWALFAKRYKGIPNSELSFNLINEPINVDNKTYTKVVKMLVEAIRKEDPDRLIIADGISTAPVYELAELGIAQSTRGYQPIEISHYHTPWKDSSNNFPTPQWPIPYIATPYIYGQGKKNLAEPLVIEGNFTEESELRFHVMVVSDFAQLVIKADGKEVFKKYIKSGPEIGECKKVIYKEKWKLYQNLFDIDYVAYIPANTKKIEIGVTNGDWLTFSELEIKPLLPSQIKPIKISPTVTTWGVKPQRFSIDSNGQLQVKDVIDKAWLKRERIAPWKDLEAKQVGVMVGEWGAYNKTSHDVALKWMQDCLENWKEADWGWALWNFYGEFGILDSARTDVKYEDFHGHKLDKEMLALLKKY